MDQPVRKTARKKVRKNQQSYSPSFTSYFNSGLAQIAVRVTSESTEVDDDDNAYLIQYLEPEERASMSNTQTSIRNQSSTAEESDSKNSHKEVIHEEEEELESEFEFEFDLANLLPPTDLGPVYPVFNRELLPGSFNPLFDTVEPADSTSNLQIQMKTLILDENREDRPLQTADDSSSSSSSDSEGEGEELDSILPGTFCIWKQNKSPSSPSPNPNCCTKSNSTGSVATSSSTAAGKSKLCKLRDLLRRSKSDGKNRVVLITPLSKQKKATAVSNSGATAAVKGKAVAAARGVRGSPARESFEYYYYRKGREGDSGNVRWKSYLPYKQDLVGFFVTP